MSPVSTPALPAHALVPTVSAWVVRFATSVKPSGTVLDLACGQGRHARYLADQGFTVVGVDRDAAALAHLTGVANVTTRCADLEAGAWPYGERQFDGIVVTNYLHRPLLPLIVSALMPGGVLLYETFRSGNESYGKPSNPEFLLQPGELLAFARTHGLQVVAYEDGFSQHPKPAMVQRLCAIKPPLLAPERGQLE